MEKVRVGVLGSGDVGRVLAGGFIKLGHDVKIGSRDPEKLREWAEKAGECASTGTLEETAKFGDLIVLATHGAGAENALRLAGPGNFDGKVVKVAGSRQPKGVFRPRAVGGQHDEVAEFRRLLERAGRGALARLFGPFAQLFRVAGADLHVMSELDESAGQHAADVA